MMRTVWPCCAALSARSTTTRWPLSSSACRTSPGSSLSATLVPPKNTSPRPLTVTVGSSLGDACAVCASGRSTGSPDSVVMKVVVSMKKMIRRNTTSTIGVRSMVALVWRDLLLARRTVMELGALGQVGRAGHRGLALLVGPDVGLRARRRAVLALRRLVAPRRHGLGDVAHELLAAPVDLDEDRLDAAREVGVAHDHGDRHDQAGGRGHER